MTQLKKALMLAEVKEVWSANKGPKSPPVTHYSRTGARGRHTQSLSIPASLSLSRDPKARGEGSCRSNNSMRSPGWTLVAAAVLMMCHGALAQTRKCNE